MKEVSVVSPTKTLSTTLKLSWEAAAMELMEVSELVMEELSAEAGEELLAEAGAQPRRKQ